MENIIKKYREFNKNDVSRYIYMALSGFILFMFYRVFSAVSLVYKLSIEASQNSDFDFNMNPFSLISKFQNAVSSLYWLRVLSFGALIFVVFEFYVYQRKRKSISKVFFAIGSFISSFIVLRLGSFYSFMSSFKNISLDSLEFFDFADDLEMLIGYDPKITNLLNPASLWLIAIVFIFMAFILLVVDVAGKQDLTFAKVRIGNRK